MSALDALFGLSPEQYGSHALHAPTRDFRETNCYIDVWIEVLHALGLEPLACLGVTLASDFEGDQWTFFKPSHADLERLYGVRVDELTLWRPLVEQISTQLALRRIPLIEVDAYFLPDTGDHHRQHVKTTAAIVGHDIEARRLRYFHNTGFFEVTGDDCQSLLRPPPSERPDYLPPYCEIIKCDRARALEPAELRRVARELARHHLARRPARNPVEAHAAALPQHLDWIAAGGLPTYHGYSFAVVRQLGASAELASSHLRWLDGDERGALSRAAEDLAKLSSMAKMLILKLARVATSGRAPDLSSTFSEMADLWARAMESLRLELDP